MTNKNFPKYTPEGLPILTRDTINMYFIEEKKLDREDDNSFFKTLERRADETFSQNPLLEPALKRFCKEYGFNDSDAVEIENIKAAGVFVYELLKRQAEVNKLED
jgi:hypothetical protein